LWMSPRSSARSLYHSQRWWFCRIILRQNEHFAPQSKYLAVSLVFLKLGDVAWTGKTSFRKSRCEIERCSGHKLNPPQATGAHHSICGNPQREPIARAAYFVSKRLCGLSLSRSHFGKNSGAV
jgi:hypothetical protein